MRYLILVLALATPPAAAQLECRVTNIVDGDTFDCGDARIRPRCIDTPERGQTGWEAANGHAFSLLHKKKVTLVGPYRVDGFGRLVADVQMSGGQNFSQAMQALGWPNYEDDPLCN